MAAQLVQVQQQACSSISNFNGQILYSSKSIYTGQTTVALPLINNKQRSLGRRRRPQQQQRMLLLQLHYCSTTTTRTTTTSSSDEEESSRGIPLLISENGWQVRRMVESEEEMRMVAAVQAEAFYEPVVFFNHLFFQSFKAEVLSGLLYRLRNSQPNRYACLVAEHNINIKGIQQQQQLVGVVDITVQRDNDTLQYLHQAQEYLYISGIAVSTQFRRQKVGTALLGACEKLSTQWGFDHLALRAYQDDSGACTLYKNAGFIVAAKDSEWMTSWIGRRRRLLFIKKIHSTSNNFPL